MTCELSCSVTMSDRRDMSQYHNLVITFCGVGATRPTLGTGALC